MPLMRIPCSGLPIMTTMDTTSQGIQIHTAPEGVEQKGKEAVEEVIIDLRKSIVSNPHSNLSSKKGMITL